MCRLVVEGDHTLEQELSRHQGEARFLVKHLNRTGIVYRDVRVMLIYDDTTKKMLGWMHIPDDNTRLSQMLEQTQRWESIGVGGQIRFGQPLP
jgi:hypothetical protein